LKLKKGGLIMAEWPDRDDVNRLLAAIARGGSGPDAMKVRAQIRLLLDAPKSGLPDELRAEMRAALEVSQRAASSPPATEALTAATVKTAAAPPDTRPIPTRPEQVDEIARLRDALADIEQHAGQRGGIWARSVARAALEPES
jgi:hypothetical protein